MALHHRRTAPPPMIVCSCNVITDQDIRSAVSAAEDLPRNAKQVYGCLGCSAECGRCARTIKTIIGEALQKTALVSPCPEDCLLAPSRQRPTAGYRDGLLRRQARAEGAIVHSCR